MPRPPLFGSTLPAQPPPIMGHTLLAQIFPFSSILLHVPLPLLQILPPSIAQFSTQHSGDIPSLAPPQKSLHMVTQHLSAHTFTHFSFSLWQTGRAEPLLNELMPQNPQHSPRALHHNSVLGTICVATSFSLDKSGSIRKGNSPPWS